MRLLPLLLTLSLSLPAVAGEIDRPAAVQALQMPDTLLIDVRSSEEFAEGSIPGAINIEESALAASIAEVAPDKDATVVLYCRTGRRSSVAQDELQALGYRNIINGGGYEDLLPLLPLD